MSIIETSIALLLKQTFGGTYQYSNSEVDGVDLFGWTWLAHGHDHTSSHAKNRANHVQTFETDGIGDYAAPWCKRMEFISSSYM